VWHAFEKLEKSRVRKASPDKLLTNIISLVRYASGQDEYLEPFPDILNRKFEKWIHSEEQAGRKFSPEQKEWLNMIKDHISTSLWISVQDLEFPPFYERGGPVKFYQVFGSTSERVLEEMNAALLGG
jgi:type I restriction enzyme R subunit